MNKDLIIRILGKEDAIKFDDEMYNLRGMVEELRHFIILQLQVSDNEAHHFKEKLLLTSITMNLLSQKLDSVTGYTNSKNYLFYLHKSYLLIYFFIDLLITLLICKYLLCLIFLLIHFIIFI